MEFRAGAYYFMKVFSVDDVILTSQLMTTYMKINTANEKIINYRVTAPNNYCFCKISITV